MQFDPELFGRAMGESIRRAVDPLQARIAELEKQIACLSAPINGQDGAPGKDGESVTIEDVQPIIDRSVALICEEAEKAINEAMKAIPVPKDGEDGRDGTDGKDGERGQDGKSITIEDLQPVIDRAVALICEDAEQAISEAVKAIPTPKDGKDGRDGKDGERGEKGDPGVDGAGIADTLIDRDGALVVTYTDGRIKSLGQVVGVDGRDGVDGIGLDSFELEYLPDTHEIAVKASAAGRAKEIRYPAGGIRPAGYWREGTKARAGEAWVHDGSGWVALRDTESKPSSKSADWILMARHGRDGERGPKGGSGAPDAPVKLGPSDD